MVTKTESPITKNENQHIIKSEISPWLIRLVYPLANRIIFPFFFKNIHIEGKENVPKSGAVIIAPTHRSRWDALIVPYATGRMVTNRDPFFLWYQQTK